MLRRTKESKFTELELKQIKVIGNLQEEIKTLKLEVTELNKDINAYKLVINIRDNTIERIQKLLKAEMKENRELRKLKTNVVEYIRDNVYIDYYGISVFREKDSVDKLLRMLGDSDE